MHDAGHVGFVKFHLSRDRKLGRHDRQYPEPTDSGNSVHPQLESIEQSVRNHRMNFLSRIFVMGGLLVAAHTFAADAFEGKVALAITPEKGKPMTLNYAMKGPKLRMDTQAEGHQASMIMDAPNLEMT